MKHKPTAEQLDGKRAVIGGGHVLFSAYAGASKTTSLIFISDDLPDEKGLYLAFNTDVAKEASTEFKRWVECRTTHSLAFHAVAKKYLNAGKELPGRGVRRQRIHEVASIIGVNDGYYSGKARLSRNSLTYLAMQTVVKFCYSADDEVTTAACALLEELGDVERGRDHRGQDAGRTLRHRGLGGHHGAPGQPQLPARLLPQAVPVDASCHQEGLHHAGRGPGHQPRRARHLRAPGRARSACHGR
jgi:hypothetical protein